MWSCEHKNSCLSNYWSGSRRVCRTRSYGPAQYKKVMVCCRCVIVWCCRRECHLGLWTQRGRFSSNRSLWCSRQSWAFPWRCWHKWYWRKRWLRLPASLKFSRTVKCTAWLLINCVHRTVVCVSIESDVIRYCGRQFCTSQVSPPWVNEWMNEWVK